MVGGYKRAGEFNGLKNYDELHLMISKGSDLLLNSLSTYYDKHPEYRSILNAIIEGDYAVSLRVIDWFITHYSKYKNIMYWIDERMDVIHESVVGQMGPHLKKFHLYLEYRAQLKSYTKLNFDPFRRHQRISFVLENKPAMVVIETTIGQLNFFKWIFQNHVLDYIMHHQSEIELQMLEYQNKKKAAPEAPKQSRGHCKPINNTFYQSQCCLRFD